MVALAPPPEGADRPARVAASAPTNDVRAEIKMIITAMAGNCGANSSTTMVQNITGMVRSYPDTNNVRMNSSNERLKENRKVYAYFNNTLGGAIDNLTSLHILCA